MNDTNKLVSIIIPVYNGEKYITKCIDSALTQTYKNIEIIVVNDGSVDKTEDIIKQYNSEKIKIINQENKGVSIAKNVGIKNAKGVFFFFLDSDDWLNDDYVEKMIENMEGNDILISGNKQYNEQYKQIDISLPKESTYTKFKYCITCGKFYKTSIVRDNNIKFDELKIKEDILFNLRLYSLTDKVKTVNYAGYNKLEHESSLTRNILFKYDFTFLNIFSNKLSEKELDLLSCDDFYAFLYKSFVFDIFYFKKSLSFKQLKGLYKESLNFYINLLNKNNYKFSLIRNIDENKRILFLLNIFILFTKLHLQNVLLLFVKVI